MSVIVRALSLLFFLVTATAASAQVGGGREPKVQLLVRDAAVAPGGSTVIAVVVEVADGFHAQSAKPLDENLIPFTVTATPPAGVTAGKPSYPDGKLENYPGLGDTSVYAHQFVTYISIATKSDVPAGAVEVPVSVRYQICDDQGTCFPPKTWKGNAKLDVAPGAKPDAIANTAFNDPRAKSVFVALAGSQEDQANSSKTEPTTQSTTQPSTQPAATIAPDDGRIKTLPAALGFALLAGLIFNVMPCVLPVLPLKIAGFYEAAQHDRGRTTLFGVMFSLGVLAVFAVLATLVLLGRSVIGSDYNWGQQFGNPWFVWPMVIVLAALGAGMFGAFNVNLPSSIYGLNFRHDTLGGNFMWGGLTAILSTPCTAFFFPIVLAYALAQPIYVGYLALLTVGVGMALPYMLLSIFPEAARGMPRTGPASELIKQTLAFFLFGTAAFFAGTRLASGTGAWWFIVPIAVWGGLFIVVRGIQLFSSSGAMLTTTAMATVAVVGSVGGAAYMTGLFDEAPIVASSGGGDSKLGPRDGLWYHYSPETFAAARVTGRPVLLKFTATWCQNCHWVERTVYTDRTVQQALADHDVIPMKVDLTRDDAVGYELLTKLRGNGIPFTAYYAPGHENPDTLSSIYNSGDLLAIVNRDARVAAR